MNLFSTLRDASIATCKEISSFYRACIETPFLRRHRRRREHTHTLEGAWRVVKLDL